MSRGQPTEAETAAGVLAAMLKQYRLTSPDEIQPWLHQTDPHRFFELQDGANLRDAAAILWSPIGRIRLRVDLGRRTPGGIHPMVQALRNVSDVLGLGTEIRHPLEADERDPERRYTSAMAVRAIPSAGIALSEGRLPLHQDGLGTCGSVRYVAMCLDEAPQAGGEQFYVNVLAHGIQLAARDWNRFVDATRPNALEITRATGSQRISVTGPIFYVDETGIPATHFRIPAGEYVVRPSDRVAPWLEEFARELESAAIPVPISPGDCVVVDNLSMAHARAAYTDSTSAHRRLSRKWYAINGERSQLANQSILKLHQGIHGRSGTWQ